MTRFFGGLLLAIGVLIAGTTGLCTGVVLYLALPGAIADPGPALSSSPILLIGIVPCIAGIFLARAGLRMLRSDRDD